MKKRRVFLRLANTSAITPPDRKKLFFAMKILYVIIKIMISTFKHKKMTWIDLESPTSEEVKLLMKKYHIHPLVADELLRPTLRPKVDLYKDSVYLILHFPAFNPVSKEYVGYEIDFIIGKNFFITAHYQTINIIVELSKSFEADSILRANNLSQNVTSLFFYIVKQLYGISLKELDNIQIKIGQIEREMFVQAPSQHNLVRKISHIRRNILDFRRILSPHKEIFSSFEYSGKKFFGPEFAHYLNNIIGEYYKVWNMLESSKETIGSLQETNDSLLSNRTNDIMKVLTIMAFITFPLAVFTSLFGMNTKYLPIVGMSGDFWIIVGIMLSAMFVMFSFFKFKKWL